MKVITTDSICGIYCIINTITSKRYIGSSRRINKRLLEHKNKLVRGIHHSQKLQNSFNKHGIDAFQFDFLLLFNTLIDDALLKRLEQEYIINYNACHNGYVMSENTLCNNDWTKERREAIGQVLQVANLGRTHSDIHKQRVGIAKSLQNSGSGNPMAKLTEQDVINIRLMYSEGFTYKVIQAKYGIKTKSNLYRIIHRKSWKSVK